MGCSVAVLHFSINLQRYYFFVEYLSFASKTVQRESKIKNYGEKIVYLAKNYYLRII